MVKGEVVLHKQEKWRRGLAGKKAAGIYVGIKRRPRG